LLLGQDAQYCGYGYSCSGGGCSCRCRCRYRLVEESRARRAAKAPGATSYSSAGCCSEKHGTGNAWLRQPPAQRRHTQTLQPWSHPCLTTWHATHPIDVSRACNLWRKRRRGVGSRRWFVLSRSKNWGSAGIRDGMPSRPGAPLI
jgi:hypothetical protein